MCVTLSSSASGFMKRLVRLGGGGGFRLKVRPGGCSGFSTDFSIERQPFAGDTVVEEDGLRLFLEAESCELLRGHRIDFRESPSDTGLSFFKEGAPASCCGQGKPAERATVSFMPRPGAKCSPA